MAKVTIHTYDKQWEGAEVVGVGQHPHSRENTLIVQHPDFKYNPEFIAEEDEDGKHLNIGSAAFWITRD